MDTTKIDVTKARLPAHSPTGSVAIPAPLRGGIRESTVATFSSHAGWNRHLKRLIIDQTLIRGRVAHGVWKDIVMPLHARDEETHTDGRRAAAHTYRDTLAASVHDQRMQILRYYGDPDIAWEAKTAVSLISASSLAGVGLATDVLTGYVKGTERLIDLHALAEGAAMTIISGYRLMYYDWARGLLDEVIAPLANLIEKARYEGEHGPLIDAWGDEKTGYQARLVGISEQMSVFNRSWHKEVVSDVRRSGVFSGRREERLSRVTHDLSGWLAKLMLVSQFFESGIFPMVLSRAYADPAYVGGDAYRAGLSRGAESAKNWKTFLDFRGLVQNYASWTEHMKSRFSRVLIEERGALRSDVNTDMAYMVMTGIVKQQLRDGGRNDVIRIVVEDNGISIEPARLSSLAFVRPQIASIFPGATIMHSALPAAGSLRLRITVS